MNIEEKLKALAQLRAKKTTIENDLKCLEATIAMAQEEIVDEFESRQIKSMRLEGIGLFTTKVSSYPKVFDPAALRTWLDNKGISWEVVSALNSKKLQGWYNERLEAGEELPVGVETFTKATIALTKES